MNWCLYGLLGGKILDHGVYMKQTWWADHQSFSVGGGPIRTVIRAAFLCLV